jgi:hypothetical protein
VYLFCQQVQAGILNPLEKQQLRGLEGIPENSRPVLGEDACTLPDRLLYKSCAPGSC